MTKKITEADLQAAHKEGYEAGTKAGFLQGIRNQQKLEQGGLSYQHRMRLSGPISYYKQQTWVHSKTRTKLIKEEKL